MIRSPLVQKSAHFLLMIIFPGFFFFWISQSINKEKKRKLQSKHFVTLKFYNFSKMGKFFCCIFNTDP